MTTLRFEDLQLREGHWVIADLRGKGGHIRTIPVPEWVKKAVDSRTICAGINAALQEVLLAKAGMAKDEQSHGCQSETQTHNEYRGCVVTGNHERGDQRTQRRS